MSRCKNKIGKQILPKVYSPKDYEDTIYKIWEKSGYFNPDKLPLAKKRKPYVIAMPPPNVTGSLHIGHVAGNTIQDILIRFKRMQGFNSLYVPGTDHAGIATQVLVEKKLWQDKKKTKEDLGRKKFEKLLWKFALKSQKRILDQIKKIGSSCDWSRLHFTLDKNLSKAVIQAFIKLYQEGLIYQGNRIINWCPQCKSTLSDLEVEHKDTKGKLWYIKYKLEKFEDKYIVVATTRPETMLGDTAVAVNPKDKRYKNLIGQKVILPLIKRKIPIVADSKVDPEFGTGAVKVTPAHDVVDFEIGKKNKLKAIQVIDLENKMTKKAGKEFEGLTVAKARKKVLLELEKNNLIEKTKDYNFSISLCSRCEEKIEPQILKQWFIKTKPLAKMAIKAVKSGQIKIIPKRFEKLYFNWLKNIKDWCISRQIWWGHRLPVWYCQARRNEKCQKQKGIIVLSQSPKKCPYCFSKNLIPEQDTLDTWFSSALWTFSSLGWPQKTADLKRFHPTDVMETGWDLIFFWVARMIMMSLYLLNEIPFKYVYFHGLVLDEKGQKMSKSKGNAVDSMEMIKKYGADALRLSLVLGISAGQDSRLYDEKIAGFRNFANKLWNIGRFISLFCTEKNSSKEKKIQPQTLADKWILSRLQKLIKKTTENLENFKFSEAGEDLIEFCWHSFADWYIESSKLKTKASKLNTEIILRHIFKTLLKLLHPYIPFVTEKLWQYQKEKNLLLISSWPKVDKKLIDEKAEKDFKIIQEIITKIRNQRSKNKIKPDKVINVTLLGKISKKLIKENKNLIESLARAKIFLNHRKNQIDFNINI